MVAAIGGDAHIEIRAGAVVAATGSYERVPLVPGADRPGVLAARTVTDLIERHGVLPGERALLVGDADALAEATQLLRRAGASELIGPVPSTSLASVRGRARVTGATLHTDGKRRHVAIDLVVFGDRSPNLEIVLAAGAVVARQGDTLVPVLDGSGRTTVGNLFVAGSAAGRSVVAGVAADDARAAGRAAAVLATGKATPPPSTTPGRPATTHVAPAVSRGAIVCFCEDVRAWEIRAEQAAGYTDPELVKRRTGALTGPCQGKYCLQSFACLVGAGAIPTTRPPLRPVRLGDLVASETDDAGGA
jgi:thioredoxin reductase